MTSTLHNHCKDVIVLSGNLAGKSPYSGQKLNGKVEIKNWYDPPHILNTDLVFVLFRYFQSIHFI